MPLKGFEPAVPASEWRQFNVIDRTATGSGHQVGLNDQIKEQEISEPYSTHEEHEKYIQNFSHWGPLGCCEYGSEFWINTLRTGDANLRFYITTVQDG